MGYTKSDVQYSGRKGVYFVSPDITMINVECNVSALRRPRAPGRPHRASRIGRLLCINLIPQVEHAWSVSSFRIVVAHKNVKSLRIHICIRPYTHIWRCSLIVVTSEEVNIVPHEIALLAPTATPCTMRFLVGQLATNHCPLMLANRISSSSRLSSSAASFSWRSSTFRRASMRELGTDDLEVDPETDATSEAASLGAREAGAARVGAGAAAAASACFWRRSTSLSWSVAMRSPQHCLY